MKYQNTYSGTWQFIFSSLEHTINVNVEFKTIKFTKKDDKIDMLVSITIFFL